MSYIKNKMLDVVEMYDTQGMNIVEISKVTGFTEAEVYAIVSEYSESFGNSVPSDEDVCASIAKDISEIV